MTDSRPQPRPQPQSQPLVTGPRNMALLAFHDARRMPEDAEFADAPMGYALVVLRHRGRVLMVYERERECWELPGGKIEPGESPREAAVRELREETGQVLEAGALRFVGHTLTALGASRRLLYGGVFTASTDRPRTFAPNSEVSAIHWRADGEPLPGGGMVQTVDEYVVDLCGE